MKKFLCFLLWILIVASCYAGFTTFWPDIKFIWLTSDWDFPKLTIDSWWQVYLSPLVALYWYQYEWPATVTTDDEAWHVLSWIYTYDTIESFYYSWPVAVYQWHDRHIRMTISWYGTTDSAAIATKIWVLLNGNIITGSIAWWRLANPLDYTQMISISETLIHSGDYIQMSIASNKNASLTPITVMKSIASIY